MAETVAETCDRAETAGRGLRPRLFAKQEMADAISAYDWYLPQGPVFAEHMDYCPFQPISDNHLLRWAMDSDPRVYRCSFCQREFRCAQALGGHMNVHRRDRARLRLQSQHYEIRATPCLASYSSIPHSISHTKGPLPTTPINGCFLPAPNNGSEPSSTALASSISSNTCSSHSSSSNTRPSQPSPVEFRYYDFFQTSSISKQVNPSSSYCQISNEDGRPPDTTHLDLELRLGYRPSTQVHNHCPLS